VTRLGEFSPLGQLISLGRFFNIEVALFCEDFFHGNRYALMLTQRMGWATFWAIFWRTHLVTLIVRGPEFLAGVESFRQRDRHVGGASRL
jgi:hypothetical protein